MDILYFFKKNAVIIYLVFLFCVFSFGRAFSVMHLGPVYITEICLLLMIFLLADKFMAIFKLPNIFMLFSICFSILLFLHTVMAFLRCDMLVLRDTAVFSYILFLPITFILFSQKKRLKIFLWVLLAANVLGLVLGRILLYRSYNIPAWMEFITQAKAFNYLLYYGISLSFYVSFFDLIIKQKKRTIFFITFLCIFNIYMLIFWGLRTAWIALFVLFLFALYALKWRNIIKHLPLFVCFFLVFSIISLALNDSKDVKAGIVDSKMPSMFFLFKTLLNKNVNPGATASDPGKDKALNHANQLPPKDTPTSSLNEPFLAVVGSNRNQDFKNSFASLKWRFDIWNATMKANYKSIIFGKGFGYLPIMGMPPTEITANMKIKPVHNHILTIFYKMGFLGLFLFLLINVYVFLFALRHLKQTKSLFIKSFLTGALGSFIFWHTMAFFFDVIDSPPTSIFLWVIIGLIFACVEADKEIGTPTYEKA